MIPSRISLLRAPRDVHPGSAGRRAPRRPRMAADRIIPLALAGAAPGTGLAEGHVAGMGRVERLPLPRRNGARGRVRPGWALLVPKRTRSTDLSAYDRGVPRA